MPHVREREPNPDELPKDDKRPPAAPTDATSSEPDAGSTGDASVEADAAILDDANR